MRTATWMLGIVLCSASSMVLAQDGEARPDVGATASADGTAAPARAQSGWGQVMSVLTQLLQEAATREARAAGPDGLAASLASESAVQIKVTPVAGRSSFFAPRAQATPARAASGPRPQLASQANAGSIPSRAPRAQD